MATWDSLAWVTVEVSSAPPDDPNPVWVDITAYVLTVTRAQPIGVDTGRQTELVGSDFSRATLTLNNADNRFTSGYGGSPYYPWWKQGRKMRVRETVGYQTFDDITGYLQLPQTAVGNPEGADNLVTVTLIDRLGRLDTSRKFISTLAEHIAFNGGASLKAYWPYNDASSTVFRTTGQNAAILAPRLFQQSTTTQGQALVTPNSGIVAPGDDLGVAGFSVSTNFAQTVITGYDLMATTFTPTLTLAAGQILTVVAWLSPTLLLPASLFEVLSLDLAENAGSSHLAISYDSSSNWPLWRADIGLGGLSGAIIPAAAREGVPIQLAVRYGYSPNVLEFWVGPRRFVGSLSGTPPTSTTVSQITAPPHTYSGLFGHLQIYIDTATTWDFPQFTAQAAAARTGLSGQYTGQRIRTVMQYAGLPTTLLSNVDPGVAQMSKATLAGKSPTAAAREAETTEQGRLHMDGRGQLVFDDRTARYNL